MTSRPILFSAAMVRALLANTKTQTRRIVKPAMALELTERGGFAYTDSKGKRWMCGLGGDHAETMRNLTRHHCPYGQPGDQLWVRESIFLSTEANRHYYSATGLIGPVVDYEAEPPPSIGLPAKSIPSIHMPRWASRITLEITGVRVERLQDISDADAQAEGAPPIAGYQYNATPLERYRHLWESINGPGSWKANPWVWVIELKRIKS